MRRTDGIQSGSRAPQPEAEFNFGYFYRTLEEHVNHFAAQAGCPYSVADIALRVGDAFRAKAAQIRQELGNPELLLEVRTNGAAAGLRGAEFAGEALHVHSRPGRTLTLKARKAIARAQRKRWRIQKREARLAAQAAKAKKKPGTSTSWGAFTTPEARSKEAKRRQAMRKGKRRRWTGHSSAVAARSAARGWGKMTAAERSKEMRRRRQVTLAKQRAALAPAGANGAASAA